MAERPILFSAPMDHVENSGEVVHVHAASCPGYCDYGCTEQAPYGQPGDRLWVRESFAPVDGTGHKCSTRDAAFVVLSDGAQVYRDGDVYPPLPEYQRGAFDGIKWRPSIHMPRWASRITLEVISVRVERLQDISEKDARAEGVEAPEAEFGGFDNPHSVAFRNLWDSINAKRAPWASNPWVRCVEFKRVEVPCG